jgi:putative polyhydroxyalkanoate system protein
MPTIAISRTHKKPMPEARKAIERVAEHIAEKFDVTWGWDGNTLHFERAGVHGHIALARGKVDVTAHLSFLLIAIQGTVDREIRRYLDDEFGKAG